MKNKQIMTLVGIILIVIVLCSALLIGIVILGNYHYSGKQAVTASITADQAKEIAVEAIINDHNYQEMNGYNLKEIATPVQCRENCYELIYEYDVNQTKIENLAKMEVHVTIEGNRAVNNTFSEIIVSQKRIPEAED